jgi:hypothetical protein
MIRRRVQPPQSPPLHPAVERFLTHGMVAGWADDCDVAAFALIGVMIRHPRRAAETVAEYLFRLNAPDGLAFQRRNGHTEKGT